jgi:hypothetical protein
MASEVTLKETRVTRGLDLKTDPERFRSLEK